MAEKRAKDGGRRSSRNAVGAVALSQETIVAAALAIIGSGGVPALTMQKLAQRLDVGVMSLYWYFENKEALMRAVERKAREAVFGTLSGSSALTWDLLLVEHYTNLRRRVVEVPGLGALLLSSGRLVAAHDDTGSVLGVLTRQLTAMGDAGFTS